MKLYAVITESSNFDWWAFGSTEAEALNAFKKTWRSWCECSGADPYYWGSPGDKWGDLSVHEIELGKGYMDREVFK